MQITRALSPDQFYATADRVPALPGAYLLLLEIREITFGRWANKIYASLNPGRYIYAGSAFDPGGLKSRSLQTHASSDAAAVAY
jgi:Uri superfamily endonuclease